MTANPALAEKRAVIVDYDFPYPPEKVWRILTEPELLARWLMPNDFAARLGHRFAFKTTPMPAVGFDGVVHCQVLEIDPPRCLSYSWRGGRLDTIVIWTLSAKEGGTLLHLEQAGFGPGDDLAFAGLGAGWRSMKSARLLEVLAAL